ncbi:MAG: TIGR00153 family protein [Myxococcaceae bacterium]|nr:TIGR00153 family protein [Myxococcaceae bacterium]MBH2006188.1 TIGR00153 family protein [Myxococcaceae bacterium]
MLWNLLAKNPFRILQDLMQEALRCTQKTEALFEALKQGDQDLVEEIAKEISQIEHHCDRIKQELRSHISKSIFLPVDRRDLLHVLSNMDAIPDICEDLGVLLTLRRMEVPQALEAPLSNLLSSSFFVVRRSSEVISALDRLLETGFTGPDALEINKKIDDIDHLEHLADKAQDQFGKSLFLIEDDLKPAALLMWNKIANKIGDLANSAERMSSHVRLMISSS